MFAVADVAVAMGGISGPTVGIDSAHGDPWGMSSGAAHPLVDGNRSVVALTNSAGSIVDQYVYAPYGVMTVVQQSVPSVCGSHGGWIVSATGPVKFGERSYNPQVARWTQMDPLAGNPWDPQSLNRYAFVQGDPINLVDLTGFGFAACERDANAGLVEGGIGGFFATGFDPSGAAGAAGGVVGGCVYGYLPETELLGHHDDR